MGIRTSSPEHRPVCPSGQSPNSGSPGRVSDTFLNSVADCQDSSHSFEEQTVPVRESGEFQSNIEVASALTSSATTAMVETVRVRSVIRFEM